MASNSSEIWFIANFHSGTLPIEKKEEIVKEISKFENTALFKTQYPNHAHEIAQLAVKNNIAKVVAIGGDGTLNEVGAAIMGTKTSMGIVPIGSGNGLARHLKIPLNPIKAIEKAMVGNEFIIDTCSINGIPFFCTAGVGFDAQVALNFSKKKKRGFITYIITAITTFFSFRSSSYHILNDKVNAFAITFANASQYGNNATVAPESEINDGLIDAVILRPFSIFNALFIAIRLFTNSFSKSKFVTTIKGAGFEVLSKNNLVIHYDGEPKILNTNKLTIKIEQQKLKVII